MFSNFGKHVLMCVCVCAWQNLKETRLLGKFFFHKFSLFSINYSITGCNYVRTGQMSKLIFKSILCLNVLVLVLFNSQSYYTLCIMCVTNMHYIRAILFLYSYHELNSSFAIISTQEIRSWIFVNPWSW